MGDRICRGNCISYSGHACRSGSAQWSIIMTRKVISYGLFIYVGTGRSSTSSLKLTIIILIISICISRFGTNNTINV